MYPMVLVSLRACAFMILSMLAVHPYCEVTIQQGLSTSLFETTTFSTFLSKTSFMTLHNPSNLVLSSSNFFFSSSSSGSSKPSLVTLTSCLPSNSFNCWTTYSSMGSVMYTTSKPRFFTRSTKLLLATWSLLSPVM